MAPAAVGRPCPHLDETAALPVHADQLEALAAGDDFQGVETDAAFGFRQTPFEAAIRESYCHPRYSRVLVER